jgi:hypothetical protein
MDEQAAILRNPAAALHKPSMAQFGHLRLVSRFVIFRASA